LNSKVKEVPSGRDIGRRKLNSKVKEVAMGCNVGG
jgi:hypothetical protein